MCQRRRMSKVNRGLGRLECKAELIEANGGRECRMCCESK